MGTTAFTLRDLVDQSVAHQSLPAPIDGRLRRLAWVGAAFLLVANGYLALALQLPMLAEQVQRPPAALVGWGVLQRAIHLDGHAPTVFAAGVATLAAAVVLAVTTRGFTIGRLWSHVGSLLVGLAGLVAILPPGVALAIILANIVAWFVIAVVAFALGSALLAGLVSGAVDG
jgi:hypothetical protein